MVMAVAVMESMKMIREYIVKKSIGNDSGRVFSQKEVGELVRCKDCKYWLPHTQRGDDEDYGEYHNYCEMHMPDDEWYAGYWNADYYCSYGERK